MTLRIAALSPHIERALPRPEYVASIPPKDLADAISNVCRCSMPNGPAAVATPPNCGDGSNPTASAVPSGWSASGRPGGVALKRQAINNCKVPSARTIARLMTTARDHMSKADTITIAAIEAGVADARRCTNTHREPGYVCTTSSASAITTITAGSPILLGPRANAGNVRYENSIACDDGD